MRNDPTPMGRHSAEARLRFWYSSKDRRINVKIMGTETLRAYQPHQPEYRDLSNLLKAAAHWPNDAIEPTS